MSKTLAQIQIEINADLNERTEQIWQWVRENKQSLDSERGCRMIRLGIDQATESVCQAVQPMLTEIDGLKAELKAAKLALKKSEEGCTAMNLRNQAVITRLTRQLNDTQDDLKITKLSIAD